MSHLGPLGQLNLQPKDVIIVEVDNDGNVIGSFHNKNGPVSISNRHQHCIAKQYWLNSFSSETTAESNISLKFVNRASCSLVIASKFQLLK